jgi:hypothetical protein
VGDEGVEGVGGPGEGELGQPHLLVVFGGWWRRLCEGGDSAGGRGSEGEGRVGGGEEKGGAGGGGGEKGGAEGGEEGGEDGLILSDSAGIPLDHDSVVWEARRSRGRWRGGGGWEDVGGDRGEDDIVGG